MTYKVRVTEVLQLLPVRGLGPQDLCKIKIQGTEKQCLENHCKCFEISQIKTGNIGKHD